MLGKIEHLSNQAQIAISAKIKQIDDKYSIEYQGLDALKKAYAQLDALIHTAKDQHATVGAFILSRQLSQTEQELNAAQLLRNFLKVLDYPLDTTFSMNQRLEDTSFLDTAKTFSMFPLIITVVMCSIYPPALVLSFKPALMLLISSLPLAIAYAYDKPFSMSRFYQEMAGIEKTLSYFVLGSVIALFACILAPEVTMLMFGMLFIGMLSTGLALLWHSNHLQAKHEHLKQATTDIRSQINTSGVLGFFSPQAPSRSQASTPDYITEMERTVLSMTA